MLISELFVAHKQTIKKILLCTLPFELSQIPFRTLSCHARVPWVLSCPDFPDGDTLTMQYHAAGVIVK